MGILKKYGAATAVVLLATAGLGVSASTAATAETEVVTEGDVTRQVENTTPTDDWVLYTRAGTPPTAGTFVDGPAGRPLGTGSLELSTATSAEKVYLFNYDYVNMPLSAIDGDISYSTFRTAADNPVQVAALNVQIDLNGFDVPDGFSTLVFEPVYNTDQGSLVSGEWQDWTASGSGVWWSTGVINGQCSGATAACDKTWAEIIANNPDAVIGGIGVNQGSGNPGLTTNVDAFTFDGTTYDFEKTKVQDDDGDGIADTAPPVSKDDCKKGGFASFNNPSFKNQGACVSYVATRK